jgi:hypothetical protein
VQLQARHKTEELLLMEEARLRRILQTAKAAILVADRTEEQVAGLQLNRVII